MNQSLLHADIILRDRARERDAHVEEGRVLRALDADASGRTSGRHAPLTRNGAEPYGLRARIVQLWSGVRLPARPDAQQPLCIDSPLLQAAE